MTTKRSSKHQIIGAPMAMYYQETGFNPTAVPIQHRAEWESHRRKRYNLYINKLQLPLMLWKGTRVLEIGPSSGENALVWAKEGATFDFVEPCPHLIEELLSNFSQYEMHHKIGTCHQAFLEDFYPEKRYDVIIAEGFLFCLPERDALLTRLASWVSEKGLLIISTEDPYGSFIEHCKVSLFRAACSAASCSCDEERLKIAEQMLAEDFSAIPHSRSFTAFARDTFFFPNFGPAVFWGLEDLQPLMAQGGFYLYSSWPNYMEKDDLTWHKKVMPMNTARTIQSYRKRIPYFITGGQDSYSMNPMWSYELGTKFGDMVTILQELLFNVTVRNEFPTVDWKMYFAELYKSACCFWTGDQRKFCIQLLKEVEKILYYLFTYRYDMDSQAYIQLYLNSTVLRSTWGMPYHYQVWMRQW